MKDLYDLEITRSVELDFNTRVAITYSKKNKDESNKWIIWCKSDKIEELHKLLRGSIAYEKVGKIIRIPLQSSNETEKPNIGYVGGFMPKEYDKMLSNFISLIRETLKIIAEQI